MSLFLKKFQGQHVELVVNMTVTEELENGDTKMGPLILQAFIVDCDDKFIYTGKNPLEIDSAIKFDDIRYLSIVDPNSYEDLLVDPEIDTELN